jgi:hypothetical protein
LSATIGSTRWSGPSTCPVRVVRLTVEERTRTASGNTTGASWCEVKIIPRWSAQPVGEMFATRSGPSTESRCQSPQ